MNIRFDRNGRDILNGGIAARPLWRRSRFADERRDVATQETIGPPSGDALESLLGRDDAAANCAVSPLMPFVDWRSIRGRNRQQTRRQNAQRQNRRSQLHQRLNHRADMAVTRIG
jgi:hypothetical protein